MGRQYDITTTFAIVKERLENEFTHLYTPEVKVSIAKCTQRTIQIIESFYCELEEDGNSTSDLGDSSDCKSNGFIRSPIQLLSTCVATW